jgi:hypothetical protein
MSDNYYDDGGVIIADPQNSNVFWTGGASPFMAVSKTTDQGDTWTRYSLTTDSGYAHAIALDPGNSNTVYAGGTGGLFKTTNAGTTWSDISTGINGAISSIAVNPVTTDMVYAGTPNGVFQSTDAGGTWIDIGCTDVNDVVIIPAYPDSLFAATNSGVYLTTDSGNSWMLMNQGLPEYAVTCLGSDRTDYLFCSTMGAGMFRQDIESSINEMHVHTNNLIMSAIPNPARTSTTIRYDLQTHSHVNLSIYDCMGRSVKHLCTGVQSPGVYYVNWDLHDRGGQKVPHGVYFCTLRTDIEERHFKLAVIR